MVVIGLQLQVRAELTWKEALDSMPVATNSLRIFKTAAPQLILSALRSNEVVKGIVFLPAATDELYFFDHGLRTWAGQPGSLTDALTELTNGTPFQITYQKPLLLVHVARDRLDPVVPEEVRGKEIRAGWSGVWIDAPWERVEPALAKVMGSRLSPAASSKEAWHFYRMYAAGQGLGGAELMRAVALAGRLKVARHGSKLHFALDDRPMLLP